MGPNGDRRFGKISGRSLSAGWFNYGSCVFWDK